MARTPLYPDIIRTCVICGGAFTRNQKERPNRFRTRQTCGHDCAVQLVARSRRARRNDALKQCSICGVELVRGEREQQDHFNKRLTCSSECRSRRLWQTRKGNQTQGATLPKTCAFCGELFHRRANEALGRFAGRITCGRTCAVRLNGRNWKRERYGETLPDRFCRACGVLLVRKPQESLATFMHRKACDQQCGSIYACMIRQRGRPRRCPYPKGWHALRDGIRKRDNYRCRVCNATSSHRRLPVHHIDYDKQNCTSSNLITLCEPCHNRTTHSDRRHWQRALTAMMQEIEP
jgi:5-methylcytosine-specific restriction endonuclease McrA